MRAARFPLVDSMRALAALSILGFHGAAVTGAFNGGGLAYWYAQLNVGVPLFFAISGFLLYRPWVVARIEGAEHPDARVYAIRRVLRIVPAYWVALTVIAIVADRDDVFSWPGALIHYGFLQAYDSSRFTGGIGQAWTLTVEVAFYAALPLIALGMRRLRAGSREQVVRQELIMLAVLAGIAIAWRLAVVLLVAPTADAYFPLLVALPGQLDVFAGGMALAVLSAAGRDGFAAPPRFALVTWALALAAYAAVVYWRPRDPDSGVFVQHQLQAVVAVALLAPAVLAAGGGGSVRRLLAWKPLAWVGLVSYGLYLWHLDVLKQFSENGASNAAIVLGGSALALALGAASWYLVERRSIALGRRAAGRPAAPREAGRPDPTTAETVGR